MLELSIWPKPPRGAFQRAGRLLWGGIYRERAERMVRVRSDTPATPSPDTGGAETADPPASIIVNNYYCVGDDSSLVPGRREFLARQRAQRPGAGAPSGYPPLTGSERQIKASSNWASLTQAIFFRNVQRWRCRELQKRWGWCMHETEEAAGDTSLGSGTEQCLGQGGGIQGQPARESTVPKALPREGRPKR